MLHFVTGLPGAGKSLWTIKHIMKLAEDSSRPVFYHGIPNLQLDWSPLDDPKTWYECPQGSIIVIDEAQKTFRNRKVGDAVPQYVSEFETHRHKGFDVYLLTQDAMLVDIACRRLAGKHYHLKRVFGLERAALYEWQEIAKPNDYHDRQEALKTEFDFPKEVYDLYTSADLHTVKKSFPWRKLWWLPIAVVGAIWSITSLFDFFDDTAETAPISSNEFVSTSSVRTTGVFGNPILYNPDMWVPEIDGLDYSAAFYDELIKAKSFPKISGCADSVINGEKKCECYSQQATRLRVTYQQCKHYMANGWFDFTKDDREEERKLRREEDAENRFSIGDASGAVAKAQPARTAPVN